LARKRAQTRAVFELAKFFLDAWYMTEVSDAPKLSEEQYILRFPEQLGERIQKMVQNDELSSDQITFQFPRITFSIHFIFQSLNF